MSSENMLSDWLYSVAEKLDCVPKPGNYTFHNVEYTGWFLKTNGHERVFCLDTVSREKITANTGDNIKYLHKKDSGAQPVLFVNGLGIPSIINENIREKINSEGLVLCEGWKGALAVCGMGRHCLAMNGCYSSKSVAAFLKEKKINPNAVQLILPDTDILWNLKVNTGYLHLVSLCPQASMYVYPPKNIVNDDGKLNFSKASPDDWITDDMVDILKPLKQIDFYGVREQLIHQKKNWFPQEVDSDSQLQKSLLEQFERNLFFVPNTALYYIYNDLKGIWDCVTLEMLTFIIVKDYGIKNISFTKVQQIIKMAATVSIVEPQFALQLFCNTSFLGFTNGTWDFEQKKLVLTVRDQFHLSLLPYSYQKVSGPIKSLAPNILKWISERVSGSEIQLNTLWAIMLACILQIEYPERFLFLPGHSNTGKSTFFQLLTCLLPPDLIYAVSPEAFSSDFGLEDFADGKPKRVIIFHDIGGNVNESFINMLRTMVSSTGETTYKRVRRKNKQNATMYFSGFICAASNKSPFTQVQSEGIIDRRLILIPFNNRVKPQQIKSFEEMFPHQELENIVSFATQVNKTEIREFLLIVAQHPEMQQLIEEHYVDSGATTLLDMFINQCIIYDPKNWVPYGDAQLEYSLFFTFTNWFKDLATDLVNNVRLNEFKQQLLPLIQSKHPHWDGVVDKRRLTSDGRKIRGISGIQCMINYKTQQSFEEQSANTAPFEKYKITNWWISAEHIEPEVEPTSSEPTISEPISSEPISVEPTISEPISSETTSLGIEEPNPEPISVDIVTQEPIIGVQDTPNIEPEVKPGNSIEFEADIDTLEPNIDLISEEEYLSEVSPEIPVARCPPLSEQQSVAEADILSLEEPSESANIENLAIPINTVAHRHYLEKELQTILEDDRKKAEGIAQRSIPPAPQNSPQPLINPSELEFQQFCDQNTILALDTEFSISKHLAIRRLAYIQLYGLQTCTAVIFAYQNKFANFSETFLTWLEKPTSLLLGFSILTDLINIWCVLEDPPTSQILLNKVCDLQLVLKFTHNGYKNSNSLADWARRSVNIQLDKSFQKTNWFQVPLTEPIQLYLVTDVWILHHLFQYSLAFCSSQHYKNTFFQNQ
uniref:SF3 helicase domain-containing protein n=1 Tax=Halimeda discoidea TaxID=118222 RepID=A0A1C9JAZ6_9CHLO|nr:hypothetical protein [Halimeda discoidea]